MDRATFIRTEVFTKLTGIKHLGVEIPVFDEFVNPSVALPSIGGASQVYIILQDQQEQKNDVQTFCHPRFNLNLTIRVVTIWRTVGSKKLCEDIGDAVFNLLTDSRGTSKINEIEQVELVTAQSLGEESVNELAFNKILILNFIKNG